MTRRSNKGKVSFIPTPDKLSPEKKAAAVKLTPVICKFLMKYSVDHKRRRIIDEIIQTEKNYINSLSICEDVYFLPLDRSINSKNPLIDSDSMRQLFGNIDQILDVHQNQLLKTMDEALPLLSKPFPPHNAYLIIANAFIEVLPKLQQLYPLYLSSTENQDEVLKKLKKSKKFSNFLNEALFNPICKCQEIDDLLILPTQRIAGYKILFERLLKYFPIESFKEEHDKFTEAYNFLGQIGKEMNSEKVDGQTQKFLLNLTENLTKQPPFFTIMKPGRRYIQTFTCTDHTSDKIKGKKNIKHKLYMFNDILLITAKPERATIFSSHKYIYIDAVPLAQLHFSAVSSEKDIDHTFQLGTDTQEYNFFAKSSYERDLFIMKAKKIKSQIFHKAKKMTEDGTEFIANLLNQIHDLYYSDHPKILTLKEALDSI
ncbi:hypothetical protein M9Y10_005953 [Tritrichomonas musculus]|uniref:DH domain-containing protein n=1 Tax=Tritrichomonas musculus TaxID=1915356 RepID=A0ABR2JE23_9EUKA